MNPQEQHVETPQNGAARRIDMDAILAQRNGGPRTQKLAVIWPWQSPFVYTRCMESILHLKHPAGYETDVFRGSGWSPALRHLNGCEQACAWGADYLVILGADQLYEPDLLCRLVARLESGFEAVSCMLPTRGFLAWNHGMKPFGKVAWRFKASTEGLQTVARQYHGQAVDPDMLELIDSADGDMQRCHFVGSGVLAFRREHLDALAKPWFYETVEPLTQQRYASMDTRFSWRLQWEAGAALWVDTSINVKHLHIFAIDSTFSERFQDWAIPHPDVDMDICRYFPTAVPHSTVRDDAPEPLSSGAKCPRGNEPAGWKNAHPGVGYCAHHEVRPQPVVLPSSFFDRYRRNYATMSFAEHQQAYSLIERVYPDQSHYDRHAVSLFLERLIAAGVTPSVLELGGWKGELAHDMLRQFRAIGAWHNIEICREAVEKTVCADFWARYTCSTLDDFFWNEKPNWVQMHNTIVLSHVVEHMRLQDFAGMIAHCAAKWIDYLYIDIPHITEDSHKTWHGWTNTHILEGGWNDIDAILAQHGYDKWYGESTPRCYASQRGMMMLRKEQCAHADA